MAISSNKLAKVSAILMIALVCLAFCQHSDAPVQNEDIQKDQITTGLRMLSQAGYNRCIDSAQAKYRRCHNWGLGNCEYKYAERARECAREHL